MKASAKSVKSAKRGSGQRTKVLVVDDDEEIRKQLRWALADEYRVFTASERTEALDLLRGEDIDLVLLDLGLPPKPRDADEGLATLEEILLARSHAKVIIVSGNSERSNAAAAVARGAHDIFPKPVDVEELRLVLARTNRLVELGRDGPGADGAEGGVDSVIGSSPAMREVMRMVKKVAPTDVPLLITGETGTGKERLAAVVHASSAVKDGPFVPINCGAIPENLLESELFGHEKGAFTGADVRRRGKIEYADGGTLFLDEIGDLAGNLQVKLLRFLQEKVVERVGGREAIAVQARVVAATNVDLEAAVAERRFREDLYFRLAVVKIPLPPLRARGDDVLLLAEKFLGQFSEDLGRKAKRLSRRAVRAVQGYSWPGNVRELQNRIRRAIVCSEKSLIEPDDLEIVVPAGPGPTPTLREARERLELKLVRKALVENHHNISRTARALGVSRPTLYDLMARHGLSEPKE